MGQVSINLLVSGIFLSTSSIIFLRFTSSKSRCILETNPLIGTLLSKVLINLTNLSYSVFLTTPFFTASLSLLKLTRTVCSLSTSNLSHLDFRLAK